MLNVVQFKVSRSSSSGFFAFNYYGILYLKKKLDVKKCINYNINYRVVVIYNKLFYCLEVCMSIESSASNKVNTGFSGLESTQPNMRRNVNETQQINRICLIINQHTDFGHTKVDSIRKDILKEIVDQSARELLDNDVVNFKGNPKAVEKEKNKFMNLFYKAFNTYSGHSDMVNLTNYEKQMVRKLLNDHISKLKHPVGENKEEPSIQRKGNGLVDYSKAKGEINRFETNYDRFCDAKTRINSTSNDLSKLIASQEDYFSVESLVIGAGDIGTHLWLNKKDEHNKTTDSLKKKQIPETLIIAEDYGNWRHDYTLAQTHSLLERYGSPSNPKDFALSSNYETNAQVNARHLYQSNVVSLSETNAPVCIGAKILKVEKQSKHAGDWKADMQNCNLRAKVRFTLNQEDVVVFDKDGKNVWRSLDDLGKSELEGEKSVTDEDLSGNPPWEKNFEKTEKKLEGEKSVTDKDLEEKGAKDNFEKSEKKLEGEEKEVEQFVYEPKLNRKGLPATVSYTKNVKGKLEIEYFPVYIRKKVVYKTVYTKELDVCAGMGKTAPFGRYHTKSYADKTPICSPDNLEKLTKFDSELGFTPICDGNTFMLTAKEEPVWEDAVSEVKTQDPSITNEAADSTSKGTKKKEGYKPRDIMISGGGGNATACYRKAYFGSDVNIEKKTYETKHRRSESEVYWTSMYGGFEDAGYGTLAKNAVTAAESQGRLFAAKPINVEPIIIENSEGKKVQKLKVTLIPVDGTFNKKKIDFPDEKKIQGKIDVRKDPKDNSIKEFTVVVDQFVYASGQDTSEGLEKVVEEFKTEMQLNQVPIENPNDPDNPTMIPVGLSDIDNSGLRLWGGAAQQFAKVTTPASGDKLNFNEPIRAYIQSQNFPADSEWPGVMPPTRFEVQYGTERAVKRDNVNINLEDINVIKQFLLNIEVNPDDVESFANEVLFSRSPPTPAGTVSTSPAGITNNLLNEMIKAYKLEDKVEVVGHCILKYKE